jgi:subtilisin
VNDWLQQYPLAAAIAATATGLASIVGSVLFGVWRLQRSHSNHLDKWLTAHESAEHKQFRSIKRLTAAVKREQRSTAQSFSRLADAVGAILAHCPREAQYHMRSHTLHDPATGEPIYSLPPDEMRPELLLTAEQLSERRDWGHEPLGLAELHARGINGEGGIGAVLDTGVDPAHPDLVGQLIESWDETGSGSGPLDRNGHGIFCFGQIFASDNGSGMIGVAPKAKGLSGKVLGDNGSGGSGGIARAIRRAADRGADVISLSLGSPAADQQIRDAIDYAGQKGCWVVAAAGNEGPREGTIGFPGGFSNVVCVAAVDRELRVAGFSSRGPAVDVAAPGVQITSLAPRNQYAVMSGTSMATPYVAGCLLLVRAELKKRGLPIPKLADLLAALRETSRDLDTPGNDTRTGAGLIQPAKLIERLIGAAQPPKPPTEPVRVEIASPELASRGVKLVAFLSPVAADKPPVAGGVIGDLLPGIDAAKWLAIATKVLRAALPMLRKWAESTDTKIDDMVLDIIDRITRDATANASIVQRAEGGAPAWWPIAVHVIEMLLPLLKRLGKDTGRRSNDMVVALIERLVANSGAALTAEGLRNRAWSLAASSKLLDPVAA